MPHLQSCWMRFTSLCLVYQWERENNRTSCQTWCSSTQKEISFSLLFFTGVTLLRVSLKASLESGDRGRTYLGKNAGTNWVILTPVEKQKSERVRYSGSQTGIYERSLGPIEERSIPPFERRRLAGPSHVRLAEFWGKFEARFSPSCRRFVRGLARKVDVANSSTWWFTQEQESIDMFLHLWVGQRRV